MKIKMSLYLTLISGSLFAHNAVTYFDEDLIWLLVKTLIAILFIVAGIAALFVKKNKMKAFRIWFLAILGIYAFFALLLLITSSLYL